MVIALITIYLIAAVFMYFLSAVNKTINTWHAILFAFIWPIIMIIFLIDAFIEDRKSKANK